VVSSSLWFITSKALVKSKNMPITNSLIPNAFWISSIKVWIAILVMSSLCSHFELHLVTETYCDMTAETWNSGGDKKRLPKHHFHGNKQKCNNWGTMVKCFSIWSKPQLYSEDHQPSPSVRWESLELHYCMPLPSNDHWRHRRINVCSSDL
jgi:hypothetical protein